MGKRAVKEFLGPSGDSFRSIVGSRVCISGANLLSCAGDIVGAASGFVYGDEPHEFNGSVATSVVTTCCDVNYSSERLFVKCSVDGGNDFRGCLGGCSIRPSCLLW